MKLVLVLVDALKSSYLTQDNMPFLWSLSRSSRYIKRIVPSAGFCERGELFSGLDCYDTGNFSAIGYLPEFSCYHKKEWMLGAIRQTSHISEKICRRLVKWYCRHKGKVMRPYKIPVRSLGNFALTEDGDYRLTDYRTLFDVLEESGLTYSLAKFASLSGKHKMTSLNNHDFIVEATDKGIDFIPVYIGEMDYYGHHYADDIEKLKEHLLAVDSQLKDHYEQSLQAGYAFAVLGDHGMVPVKETINIFDVIDGLNIKQGKDYEIFVDSTAVRFWCYKSDIKEMIEEVLNKRLLGKGIVVNIDNYEKLRIPLDIKNSRGIPVYGDIVWMANPGVLLVPDYFNPSAKPDKGMHGYMEIDQEHGTGLFVASVQQTTPVTSESAHLSDVCNELCSILNIDTPNPKTWKRRINQ